MDVVDRRGDRHQPAPARGDRRVQQHASSAPSPQVIRQPLYEFYVVVRRPGPDAHARGARDRHDLHGLVCADHAGHPDAHVQPRGRRVRRGGKPEHELRQRPASCAPTRAATPTPTATSASCSTGIQGKVHERQAAPVLDQQHGRRAGRDADLERVDGERHQLGQQAGARPAARCRTPRRSRPGPGSSGT